ncbi:MAG: tRNA lysidine(34) synthetase TilS [Gallionella sp.]
MASSRKSNSVDLAQRLAGKLAQLIPPHSSILIAYSGGVDSVVLLHLLHHLAHRNSWQLSALHVHHGISPDAEVWAEFCEQRCAAYNISFHLERVDITPLREQGIEAAARHLRYQAFAKHHCDFLALAHHADDQAETLMLQLLRGSGVRGVSAMPMLAERGVHWLRPLLDCTRAEIVEYAQTHHLTWIEDASNADDAYPRNFLRHKVFPVLGQRFPSYRQTLARSAQHFAEASGLLDELAELDATSAIVGQILQVTALQKLSSARAKNLLRYFLQRRNAPMPQTVQLDDMLQQLCHARGDAELCIAYAGWEVHRYRDEVYAAPALPILDVSLRLPWHEEATLFWPTMDARIDFVATHGKGISLAKLRAAPVTLRVRQGGEMLRPNARAKTRKLKNLLQEQNILPWLRDRTPLLFCGEELVCVPGAVAAEYQAGADEEGVEMQVFPRP